MKKLLALQTLDLKIESLKQREEEIPKQKKKFDIHRERLKAELEESESRFKALQLEQRDCEKDIQQRQEQIRKYDTQLLAVKKNEEYQALLHEIEGIKKQIGLKEERIIGIMLELDEAKVRLEEDRKRIQTEQAGIDRECAAIDAELAETVKERKGYEAQRAPLAEAVEARNFALYERIRKSKKGGAAAVPINGESCSGCFMKVRAQTLNELMAANRTHTCPSCGRILYHPDALVNEPGAEII